MTTRTPYSRTHRSAVVVPEDILVEVVEELLFQLEHDLPGQRCFSACTAPTPQAGCGWWLPLVMSHLPSGHCLTPEISTLQLHWYQQPGLSASWPLCRASARRQGCSVSVCLPIAPVGITQSPQSMVSQCLQWEWKGIRVP